MLATVGNTHKVEDGGASEWLDSEWVLVVRKDVEDGVDVDMEDLEELGVVMNYATGKEVERRIAFPGARVELTPAEGPFSFQKVFGDSDFFAAGVMKVPVGDENRTSTQEGIHMHFIASRVASRSKSTQARLRSPRVGCSLSLEGTSTP
ncbi:hypothetical protein FRC08_008393 [Ceratobasidium sp. 394]|nr:hypothetical protein FRC08_008393 [Ceratobasidium sp. 394]